MTLPNIDNLTIGEAKQMASLLACFLADGNTNAASDSTLKTGQSSAYEIGKKYMFRTVTHIVTGQLLSIHPDGLRVRNAAWVASTGRYMQAVASGNFDEVEPYPAERVVIVNFSAMIDAVELPKLPSSQK